MSSRDNGFSGGLSLRSWLRRIDDSGGLDRYLHVISQHYSGPSQVAASYTVPGENGLVFDSQFFEDMGIEDVKHKRMFQRWFETETLPAGSEVPGAARGIGRAMRSPAASSASAGSAPRRTWRPPARSAAASEQPADDPTNAATRGSGDFMEGSAGSRWAQAERSEDERTAESGLDSDSTRQSSQRWGGGGQSWWDRGAWSSSAYASWRGDDWPRSSSNAGNWGYRWDDKPSGSRWDQPSSAELSSSLSDLVLGQDSAEAAFRTASATSVAASAAGAAARPATPQRLAKSMRSPIKERPGTPGRERPGTPGRERTGTPGRERNRGGGRRPSDGATTPTRMARSGSQGAASGAAAGAAAFASAAVPRSSGRRSVTVAQRPSGPLADWLFSLGAGGSLLRYHTPLEDFFETPEQVFLAYTTPLGSESALRFDKGFFNEVGVSDEAHQKAFEQWFLAQLSSSRAPAKKLAEAADQKPPVSVAQPCMVDRGPVHAPGADAPQEVSSSKDKTQQVTSATSKTSNTAVKTVQPRASARNEGHSTLREAATTPAMVATGDSTLREGATTSARVSKVLEGDGEHSTRPATTKSRSSSSAPEVRAVSDDAKSLEPPATGAVRAKSTPPALPSAGPATAASTASARATAEARRHANEGARNSGNASAAPSAELAAKLRQIREAATVLPDPDPRPHATAVLLGHSGVGKSMLLGGLMEVTGSWDTRQVDKFLKERRQPSKLGSASNDAAAAAEGTRMEHCKTENRRYTILDPPGHKRCVQQAWAAAAQADLAVLVVSAHSSELEAGLAKGGQTREHAVLAKSAGVESLIVAVNKLDPDDKAGRWSHARYEEVRAQIWAALKTVGFKDEEVAFVPISAATRENLACRESDSEDEDQNMCPPSAGWYSGGSMLEVLDGTPLPAHEAHGPLRLLVSGREKGKGIATPVVSGRVAQGTVEAGAVAVVAPSGAECGVQAVEVNGKEVRRATAGELVQLRLLGSQPSLGQALCSTEDPLRAASKFKAQIRFLEIADDMPIITPGFRCSLHLHGATEECEVAKLIEAVDPRTKKKEANPKFVRAPMVALCVLTLSAGHEVPAEAGDGRFARFSLRTDGGTIGVGKVAELPKVK